MTICDEKVDKKYKKLIKKLYYTSMYDTYTVAVYDILIYDEESSGRLRILRGTIHTSTLYTYNAYATMLRVIRGSGGKREKKREREKI